jgi:hypothetical protein
MKMEQIACSETLAFKLQTPLNHLQESIQHSEQGECLKSRVNQLFVDFRIVRDSNKREVYSRTFSLAWYLHNTNRINYKCLRGNKTLTYYIKARHQVWITIKFYSYNPKRLGEKQRKKLPPKLNLTLSKLPITFLIDEAIAQSKKTALCLVLITRTKSTYQNLVECVKGKFSSRYVQHVVLEMLVYS